MLTIFIPAFVLQIKNTRLHLLQQFLLVFCLFLLLFFTILSTIVLLIVLFLLFLFNFLLNKFIFFHIFYRKCFRSFFLFPMHFLLTFRRCLFNCCWLVTFRRCFLLCLGPVLRMIICQLFHFVKLVFIVHFLIELFQFFVLFVISFLVILRA